MTDTGRRVGPVEPRHPISGEVKSLEALRRERNPIVIARKEGWEVGHYLGEVKFTKGSRLIVDVEFYGSSQVFLGGCIWTDAFDDSDPRACLVHSTAPQVRAALRGTLCSCARVDEKCRTSHDQTCPLSEAA